MPKIAPQQQQVVAEINRAAGGVPPKLRRKFKLAALETGLVESGLRNLNYGTGDSKGWRQERTSIYGPSATNVRASVARFRDEFLQHYTPGETAGQVAADVQRPAAQYRGRYQQARPQALQILQQTGGVGGVSQAPGYSSTSTSVPGVDNSQARRELAVQYFQTSHSPDALLNYAQGMQTAQDVPARTITTRTQGSAFDKAGNDAVGLMKAAAEKIDQAGVPYKWGGGHAGRQGRNSPVTALDCSGAVSRVLGINPLVSGQLAQWGKPGKGHRVTVYANGTHTLMEIDGHVFGTSASNPGGGAGWIPRSYFPRGYFKNFVARHPPGM